MLLYYGLGRFSSILSDTDLKLRYATWRKRLADALDAAWEEDRYVRQFGADGRAVGAPYDAECALDLSVQAPVRPVRAPVVPTERKRPLRPLCL